MLAPFSGLPSSWLSWILAALGAVVIIVAYFVRKDRMARPAPLPPPPPMARPAEEVSTESRPSAFG